MSYNYMHMSDIKSLGVGHNVRHVKNFFRNTVVYQPLMSTHLTSIIYLTEENVMISESYLFQTDFCEIGLVINQNR